jgi:hypothetical protein
VQFQENLKNVSDFIIKEKGEEIISESKNINKKADLDNQESKTDFTEVNFEDLGKE